MYGGLLFHHFGRFLLETTNRLWWCLAEDFRGPIVFQNTRPRHGMPDFAQRYFALLGLADRIIIAERAVVWRDNLGGNCASIWMRSSSWVE